ncbi:MAG: PQQ-binding-like beta-propeller repeat protein [Bacteroidota bacterium]
MSLTWRLIKDTTLKPGSFTSFPTNYTPNPDNITAFRGGNFRNSPSRGHINGKPTGLQLEWSFATRKNSVQAGNDGSKYSKTDWGGGTGWTGQASLIQWPRSMKQALQITDPAFLNNEQAREVIIGSLSGEIYFIDFATGKPTREPLSIDGPIKGSITTDPRLNGMLYVGQGIPKGKRFGAYLMDMTKRQVNFHLNGRDPDASRGWGAFDSSPLLDESSGTLFWPGENGLIYRINVQDKDTPFVQAKLKYARSGMGRLGLEASMAAIGSHGFFGDNSGNILCVDLRNMNPVWQIDNHDDTDASLAVDLEDDRYYLYVGNEVDHRQPYAKSSLRKIDARNGSVIWEVSRECAGHPLNAKENSGGILATPLIGKNKGKDIAITIFSRPDRTRQADLVGIDKKTGKELYSIRLDSYTWASPVDFYDKEGTMYLFLSDVSGNIYLLNGMNGQLIYKGKSGYNMESSPIIYNDRIIVGTRGNTVLSFKILTQ